MLSRTATFSAHRVARALAPTSKVAPRYFPHGANCAASALLTRPTTTSPIRHNTQLTRSDAQRQTIYALSTPPGKGGVAIIRVSGPEALEVWRRMVQPHRKRSQPTPWKLERCRIVHPDRPDDIIDDGLSVFFQAPRSFTTEPTLELHTHSGRALLTTLLGALSTLPFLRPAEPGEFTKRAFLSGRLDLTEVEGLADLIDAETEEQRKIAGRGARGEIRKVLDDLRNRIIHCLAQVEALIDFGEGEDLEEGVYDQAQQEAESLLTQIQSHLKDNRRGEIIRSGIKLAIFGPPNAGKSSLLNYLARREAAIVTAIPGTTRDVLQLTLDIGGMPVVVADTAGLRKTEDVVETIGIGKGIDAVKEADIALCVLSLPDVLVSSTKSETGNEQVIQLPETIRELAATPKTYFILNKADLVDSDLDQDNFFPKFGMPQPPPSSSAPQPSMTKRSWIVSLSERQGTAQFLDGFGEELRRLYSPSSHSHGSEIPNVQAPIITRARHRVHLESACAFLQAFLECPPEDIALAAEELRYAARALGKVSGAIDVEDILDAVFRDFCIGK
ncbi:tRNA modification GTPase TrmE [Macrolepiota fuliginosa MF-IS2]|uniref:tRNA modification GTPase TrmE n=1 Tax=Macrolepiota fuliginosa MF-IS2 TaxID=1400762 RepID=A0A9P5XEZ7_9AGAR|nr:tRNA modification GTPase TrmE [Macrolepiota fuliginosa MF-IS2]